MHDDGQPTRVGGQRRRRRGGMGGGDPFQPQPAAAPASSIMPSSPSSPPPATIDNYNDTTAPLAPVFRPPIRDYRSTSERHVFEEITPPPHQQQAERNHSIANSVANSITHPSTVPNKTTATPATDEYGYEIHEPTPKFDDDVIDENDPVEENNHNNSNSQNDATTPKSCCSKNLVFSILCFMAILHIVLVYWLSNRDYQECEDSKSDTDVQNTNTLLNVQFNSTVQLFHTINSFISSSIDENDDNWPYVHIDGFDTFGNELLMSSSNNVISEITLSFFVDNKTQYDEWIVQQYDDISLSSIDTVTPYLPITHIVPYQSTKINEHNYSSMITDSIIDQLSNDKVILLSRPVLLEDNNNQPISYLINGIFSQQQLVGILIGTFRWNSFLIDRDTTKITIQNSCSSFELFDDEISFTNQTTSNAKPNFATAYSDMECPYAISIHDDNNEKSSFFKDSVILYNIIIICVISIITILLFCLYNFFIEQTQYDVIQNATRSNAILKSLFPDIVRERLLQEQQVVQQQQQQQQQNQNPTNTDSYDPNGGGVRGAIRRRFSMTTTAMPNANSNNNNMNNTNDSFNPTSFGNSLLNNNRDNRPIADLFPSATVLFADIVGFTAWSSTREPTQVFELLESLYKVFDTIARRLKVYKIETIGDCYVAATGLPVANPDHAIVMARFAKSCMSRMPVIMDKLAVSLGPSTRELCMRIGMHSGPVTGGVLRGEKSRFQLFGDTVNTASRMESTGMARRIQLSVECTELLVAGGKSDWVVPRQDKIHAKGKGELQTFWLKAQRSRAKRASSGATASMSASSIVSTASSNDIADVLASPSPSSSGKAFKRKSNETLSSNNTNRSTEKFNSSGSSGSTVFSKDDDKRSMLLGSGSNHSTDAARVTMKSRSIRTERDLEIRWIVDNLYAMLQKIEATRIPKKEEAEVKEEEEEETTPPSIMHMSSPLSSTTTSSSTRPMSRRRLVPAAAVRGVNQLQRHFQRSRSMGDKSSYDDAGDSNNSGSGNFNSNNSKHQPTTTAAAAAAAHKSNNDTNTSNNGGGSGHISEGSGSVHTSTRSTSSGVGERNTLAMNLKMGGTLLDEVQEVILLPNRVVDVRTDPSSIILGPEVKTEIEEFVRIIASMYHDNPFHNFSHASHVVESTVKLLSRIIAGADAIDYEDMKYKKANGDDLHKTTYGIASDPLTQFTCLLAALIHDVDHTGVPNAQLIKEESSIAKLYKNQSVAEQNSIDLSWQLLMKPQFENFRNCIYKTDEELDRFRQTLVNVVLATDIVDKELGAFRKNRWNKAFSSRERRQQRRLPGPTISNHSLSSVMSLDDLASTDEQFEDMKQQKRLEEKNRMATIIIEHLIQASDVCHTMQHWHIYVKWNERLFDELYGAYLQGRADSDPSVRWYEGEIGFFDHYIIPLAKKLKECGVFGVSSDEYLTYAQANRKEWMVRGREAVEAYLSKYEGVKPKLPPPPHPPLLIEDKDDAQPMTDSPKRSSTHSKVASSIAMSEDAIDAMMSDNDTENGLIDMEDLEIGGIPTEISADGSQGCDEIIQLNDVGIHRGYGDNNYDDDDDDSAATIDA